jgi:O-acetylserine/cysteine efflux transporter
MTTVCVVPPLPLLALSLAFEGPRGVGDAFAGADAQGIAAVLYLAFAATTVGWGLWGALMARYPASTVAPFALLVPAFGLSFGALLRGEPATGRDIAAEGLILGGVLLTLRAPGVAISPLVAASSPRDACIPAPATRE